MTITDTKGRAYVKLSALKPGDWVQVDDGFDGCFIPWSFRQVIKLVDGTLALEHNAPECGACGGSSSESCPHGLDGQLTHGGYLVGIYRAEAPDVKAGSERLIEENSKDD